MSSSSTSLARKASTAVTKSALAEARAHLSKIQDRVKQIQHKGEEAIGQGVSAVEVFGGSIGGGFADEKFGADKGDGIKVYEVQGVPVNLLIGAGGIAAAFLEVAGKQSCHLHDISKGFLAAYGTTLGRQIAQKTNTVR